MFIMYVIGQPQIPQGRDIKESNNTSKVDHIESNKVKIATKEYVIERQIKFIDQKITITKTITSEHK